MSPLLEFQVPAPITTGAARVVVEGELPSYGSGNVISPTWNATGSGSLWGTGGGPLVRIARFLVLIGPAGLPFSSITDGMMSEVVNADPSFASLRNCFRLKQTIAATASTAQSLYIKYAPLDIPAASPYGVALYNVTAEAVRPAFSLGKHTTSARFY